MSDRKVAWSPLTKRFGAEITIDFRDPISEEVTADLRKLFEDRHVLVFHDVDVPSERLTEVLALFGNLVDDDEYISNLDKFDSRYLNLFHNELAWHEYPLHGLGLWGEVVPPNSAGTVFLSCRNSYLDMAEEDRVRLESLIVVNAYRRGHGSKNE